MIDDRPLRIKKIYVPQKPRKSIKIGPSFNYNGSVNQNSLTYGVGQDNDMASNSPYLKRGQEN